MSAWDSIGRASDLLKQCQEEVGDPARAAVLRSEFARALDSESAIALLDVGQFCRAFALAAARLAVEESSAWPRERLIQLADMCFHFGDSTEGESLVAVADRQS